MSLYSFHVVGMQQLDAYSNAPSFSIISDQVAAKNSWEENFTDVVSSLSQSSVKSPTEGVSA